MFFLLPILLFAALAVNTLAIPQMAWPLRARSESSTMRPRKEEFQLRRTESSQRNFSLPLNARTDDRRSDRTPSPLSPRNFAFPLQARDDSNLHVASTTATGKVRPRDIFAIRPRIRPRKSDSSDESLIEPGTPIGGLSATIPSNTGLNATIIAPDGTDITSAFKIMFYQSPKIVALDGLNDRKRQVDLRDRPQTQCRSPTAVFHYSHCTPKGGIPGTTRTFQVFCRERSTGKAVEPLQPQRAGNNGKTFSTKYVFGQRTKVTQKPRADPPGLCNEDEMCLDSPMDWAKDDGENAKLYTVARCVSTRNFKQLPSVADLSSMLERASGDVAGSSMDDLASYATANQAGSSTSDQASSSSNRDLSGGSLSLRLTGPDNQPLPASIEVDAGEARTRQSSGTIESHSCPNPCLEVSTTEFPQNTNWINAHARLVSTLAWAGVMWVAFFH